MKISRDGINKLIPSTSSLHIKDCTTVHIERKSFEKLKSLIRIHLTNIQNITLEEHSFSWNDSIIQETYSDNGIEINIENSTIANLPTYVFRGRIDSIIFTQVRIETIKSYAFTSLAGTKTIIFKDCVFVHIENQAFKKFVIENIFSIIGSRFSTTLPSRTIIDVAVKNEFQINGVVFDRIRSSAFRIHGPRKFKIQNSYFSYMEGEAFVIHTRGPVFIDDNEFYAMETGAFVGISVEKHVLDTFGHQEFIFENNTISEVKQASLLFNINSFMPKIDWIYLNTSCECKFLNNWLTDLIIYSHRYPEEKISPNVKLNEIISCKNDEEYVRLKDFSQTYCTERSQPLQLFALMSIIIVIALLVLVLLYWILYRNKKASWINVPQTSPMHEVTGQQDNDTQVSIQQTSPCYQEPSASRHQAIFDDKLYKETELHVIVECMEPQQPTHKYTNQLRKYDHEYSNRYIELRKEYKNRQVPTKKNQLLTSDL